MSPTSRQPADSLAEPPVLLTVPEACERLRISRWTFYRLVQQRELRTVKIGRARRIEPSALTDYLRWLHEHGDGS